jgi:PAS domain S-box-containing protein
MERTGEEIVSASTELERTREGYGVSGWEDMDSFESFARLSPVAICRADVQGRVTYANERWEKLSGFPLEVALGDEWERAVHPEDVPRIRTEWAQAARLGIPYRTEFRYVWPDGKIVWVLGQTVEHRDRQGNLLGYISTVTDISELHRVREELQRSHGLLEERVRERTAQWEHMAMIVAASADAIVSSDMAGAIVSWNRAAERIFGYCAEEMIGRTSLAITPADRAEESIALKERARHGERVDYVETIRVARSGELIEVGLSIFPLHDATGKVIGTSMIIRDIREQKKAERRLSQLSGRLLRLQDEERRRLARELHDSTAQSLAALAMNLSVLNSSVDLPPEKRSALLADGLALAQSIERELRTHTYLLHPPLLEERGLAAALCWFVDGFAIRSGVAVNLDFAREIGRLPERVELTIFRVVQESLANVHRHAKSPTATVRLWKSDGAIRLEVRDFGCGLPYGALDCAGVGIAGMRERLAQIGGLLRMESNGKGVTVAVEIPER